MAFPQRKKDKASGHWLVRCWPAGRVSQWTGGALAASSLARLAFPCWEECMVGSLGEMRACRVSTLDREPLDQARRTAVQDSRLRARFTPSDSRDVNRASRPANGKARSGPICRCQWVMAAMTALSPFTLTHGPDQSLVTPALSAESIRLSRPDQSIWSFDLRRTLR
ncbi:hypothetical protein BDW75DRAFT_65448 [Aspergillus navahoensis]